ncbi:MAG: YkgJ family cysteine cluster protein [Vicinamibacteria bacterium]|nr:YkgJ family cysteine cluster protein [Vicinamibacteria bacterium]
MRFAPRQRFECRQCGRCCKIGWAVVLPSEAEILRQEGAGRLFSDDAGRHGAREVDPFIPIRRTALFRLGRRSDGSCGFLSPEGRCRIHAQMGAKLKPLTCRIFPFHVHAVEGGPVVTSSFSCPAVAWNLGMALAEQAREIRLLADEWRRLFPSPERPLLFEKNRPIAPRTLDTLIEILCEALERQGEGDPRPAVARMAAILDDLGRSRVARLAPDRFADYLDITGRYAVRSDRPAPIRAPSFLARLHARGFFFTVASVRLRGAWGDRSRIGLGLPMARLLTHVHGLGPPAGDVDMRRARRAKWPPRDSAIWPLVRNYLENVLTTLGTGRWPVMREIGIQFSVLNAALLAAALASENETIDDDSFVHGLNEAADVFHAGTGVIQSLIGILGGGGALDEFAGSATWSSPSG